MKIQDTELTHISKEAVSQDADAIGHTQKQPLTAKDIQVWIASYLAELLEIDVDEVETTIPFNRYGLDSAAAIGLTADLEEWLGFKLEATLMYDYPTIQALAQHLADSL